MARQTIEQLQAEVAALKEQVTLLTEELIALKSERSTTRRTEQKPRTTTAWDANIAASKQLTREDWAAWYKAHPGAKMPVASTVYQWKYGAK